MAPNLARAEEAYGQAAGRLRTACVLLERHLPPIDPTEVQAPQEPPPLRPGSRLASVPACPQFDEELRELDPGNREGHKCTHGIDVDAPDVQNTGRVNIVQKE